jgi:aminopeptidase N
MSYEYSEQDGKFTSFKIRQTPCKYGDAVFRQQRIEVGFYNEDGSFVRTIENLAIEAKEVTDVPSVVGMEVPAAILLNENDWGFGYFTLNERAITCFENSLANINCSLNRAVIINQLIIMMRQIEYPATRLPNVANQMMDEQNQNLISAVNGALLAAQSRSSSKRPPKRPRTNLSSDSALTSRFRL